MTETFASMTYGDAENTRIIAVRDDGSVRIIEATSGTLWTQALNGDLGAIAAFEPGPIPSPDGSEVDAERDRRVRDGVVVTVAGYGAVSLQGRDIDMRNLHGLATAAQLRIAAGAGAVTTLFRDKNNVIHILDQSQILDLWSQGAAFVSAIFQSAWALKDSPPIPADFVDDRYWP